MSSNIKDLKKDIIQETVSDEFSEFTASWISQEKFSSKLIFQNIMIPQLREINALESSNEIFTIGELVEKNLIEIRTGDEIGKISYGTGNIPFIRTSDFSNWEIKHNPKQGISEEIYLKYASKQDIKVNDIF